MGKKPKFRITINALTSWGASVVIIGVMAKLLRWQAADTLIIVGMLVEAILFFIMGFHSDEITVINEQGDEIPVAPVAGKATVNPGIQPQSQMIQTTATQPAFSTEKIAAVDITRYQGEIEEMVAHLKSLNSAYDTMHTELEQMSEIAGHTTRVREETEKLAKNLTALNAVYRNMLSAMNMPNA
ncbi:MAG: hypothetical protein EOO00_01575 [Chitinophagaceae bacterium]|nr:MAG: hypothetical protein EOO00_01575 [Chitinophagaceae bacterium]